MHTLTPMLSVEGKECLMLTPQLAGVATRELGPMVADLTADRATITAAIDFLIDGI
jgi:toxin CcdB